MSHACAPFALNDGYYLRTFTILSTPNLVNLSSDAKPVTFIAVSIDKIATRILEFTTEFSNLRKVIRTFTRVTPRYHLQMVNCFEVVTLSKS